MYGRISVTSALRSGLTVSGLMFAMPEYRHSDRQTAKHWRRQKSYLDAAGMRINDTLM
jgi:hypothetical protein